MSGLDRRIARVRINRQAIGDDDFLEQPYNEDTQTNGKIGRKISSLRRSDLRHDLGVMGNRTRDQLREEGYEEGIVEQGEVAHQAAMGIHQEGDLLESDEGDADRKDDVRNRPLCAHNMIYVGDKKARVFKKSQET